MGAWGIHAFDNDDACDWASELTGEGLAAVEDALEVVAGMDGEEYLEADLGARALAACEALARLRGSFDVRNSYTEDVDEWVEGYQGKVSPELFERARRAIDRVLGPESELADVWDEVEDGAAWRAGVERLRGRVGG